VTARTDTRERILGASGELFRRQGFAATGLKAILAASHAPYGSLYHFFPGGKEELGVAVLRDGGDFYRVLVETYFAPGADVVDATRRFFEDAAVVVRETDYADACPIATVALEVASTNEAMREAAAGAFESWLDVLVRRFTEAGMTAAVAREIAVELFCAIEGAFLHSRTTRTTEAIDVVGRASTARVADALRAVDRARAGTGSAR
jgi:AcrR family transcriptional regulator